MTEEHKPPTESDMEHLIAFVKTHTDSKGTRGIVVAMREELLRLRKENEELQEILESNRYAAKELEIAQDD